MRVGIDYTPAVRQGGGIGRWTRSLVGALLDLPESSGAIDYTLFYAGGGLNPQQKAGIEKEIAARRSLTGVNYVKLPFSEPNLTRLWQRLRLPLPLEIVAKAGTPLAKSNPLGKLDVLHFPDFVVPPHLSGRSLVTVHDLSFLITPECADAKLRDYLSAAVPRAVHKAGHVSVDSAAIKQDLIERLGVSPEKITVIYGGVGPEFRPIEDRAKLEEVRQRLKLPERFLLYLGTIEPRKNLARLAEAWKQLKDTPVGQGRRLVLGGRKGWLYEPILERIAELGLQDEIVWLDFVPEDDLVALYNLADLFCFPSLYEGFGIPPLEALACGTPVVTASNSSLAEVFSGAALMCDALEVDSIAEAIRKGLESLDGDGRLLTELRAAGLARARTFTWEKAAREAASLYQKLAAR
ncbi:MAG TPA: glycosyltransferase family 1 protein [Chloroflexia bacterium]|nr:glycosyltransferase family 1 protein [Chloroflexia bacterium]